MTKNILLTGGAGYIGSTIAHHLIDNGYELIVQFSGTQNEIRKVEKLISPFNIIEKTRSGLVSMTIGTDYIKK